MALNNSLLKLVDVFRDAQHYEKLVAFVGEDLENNSNYNFDDTNFNPGRNNNRGLLKKYRQL